MSCFKMTLSSFKIRVQQIKKNLNVWWAHTWERAVRSHWPAQETSPDWSRPGPRTLPRCSPAATPRCYFLRSPQSAPPLRRWRPPRWAGGCGAQSSGKTCESHKNWLLCLCVHAHLCLQQQQRTDIYIWAVIKEKGVKLWDNPDP